MTDSIGPKRRSPRTDAAAPKDAAWPKDVPKVAPADESLWRLPKGRAPVPRVASRLGESIHATPQELGSAMTDAAEALSRGASVFMKPGFTFEQKTAAFAELSDAIALGRNPDNFQGNVDQALQTRAAAAPLLLDLAESLDPSKPTEAALSEAIVGRYLKAIDDEPDFLLRGFMVRDAYGMQRKTKLPVEVGQVIDGLMNDVAPSAPPYEAWFKNGNTQLKIHYYIDADHHDECLKMYGLAGFAQQPSNPDGTTTLTRNIEVDRQREDGTTEHLATGFEVIVHRGSEGIFEHMNALDVHGIVYGGSSEPGREMTSQLAEAAPLVGKKFFLGLQGTSKARHNDLARKFPGLQIAGSRNASYPVEDRQAFANLVNGIGARQSWAEIAAENAKQSKNYYFPSDRALSLRNQDGDGDGVMDDRDYVLTVKPFKVPRGAEAEQLIPRSPPLPATQLDGQAITEAVLRVWRMAGHNEWAMPLENQGVVAAGYYDGTPEDPLFQFKQAPLEDGKTTLEVRVNSQYAHAGDEALSAALGYELGQKSALQKGLTETDARAAGLMLAAQMLSIDSSPNDWAAFITHVGLPESIEISDVREANREQGLRKAGSSVGIAKLKELLEAKKISL